MRKIRSDYLLKNWKKLNISELQAIRNKVDWHYISNNKHVIDLEFLDMFNNNVVWELISYHKLSDEIISKHFKLLSQSLVIYNNVLSEEFILKNIDKFMEYVDLIKAYQKHIPEKTLNKIMMIKEMSR